MGAFEGRVAVVDGIRTPFVKAGTSYKNYSMQELGAHVVRSLLKRSELDVERLDEVIFSTVLLDPRTPNWAREILFDTGLPKTVYAHSVSNNCISGLVAVTSAAERIALGMTQASIAGGSESMSNPALLFSEPASKIFLEAFRTRGTGARIKQFLKLRPGHFKPCPPSVTEPSTGLTMGQHMEITAKELEIGREAQDELALASHRNAHKAHEAGLFKDELESLGSVTQDLLVRGDTSLEKLSKLRAVFDRSEKGTLSAGNSSALTDGASAVLLMSESEAKAQDKEPLAFIKDYEYSAIDPKEGLLMAPAVAVPRLLKRNNLSFDDFDYIEVHEAFAAQVLANIKAWEEGWKEDAVGKLDRSKLNTLGGSIALGHPFAATGGRIVTSLARQLQRNYTKRGLISVCAAGAMACAMILERE